jgi:hypothetical protein
MFDFQSSNTARQLGKRGFAGPITPLLTQFMSYTTQMTEKLYSEAASSVGKARFGETPEETAERARQARTYLAGHLTAVTALAGSLGLPFAGAFAAGLEKLVNNFGPDDKPFDATASWRNFLAHVLGKDVGEVVARGIPRLAGLDLSTRMGEAELLPFTGMLSDRRNFHDSFTAAFGKMSGASTDMFLGVADAAHQIGQGDVLGGMKMLAPVGLKNPLEAYRMSTEGYVDTQGRKLPISAGAGAILYQLMGFSPEQKAEYSEQRNDDEQMRTGLVTEAKNRTNAILRAITNKDQPRATTLIESQQKWDAANHEYAVLPHLGQAVARLNTVQAQARALGTPLGVKPTDIAARELTSYANIAPPGQ